MSSQPRSSSLLNRRSSSISQINSRQSVGIRRKRFKELDRDKETEVLSVLNLEFWERKQSNDLKRVLESARKELEKKLKTTTEVEEKILHRKNSKPIEKGKISSGHVKDYEKTLIDTLKEKENKLNESLQTREELRKQLCNLKEEVYHYQQLIEKLPLRLMKSQSDKDFKEFKKSSSDVAKYLSNKLNVKEQINRLKFEYKEQIEILQIEISGLVRELKIYDDSTSEIRRDIKVAKNELAFHYSQLLKEGNDTRNEGLAWLVKELKKLGKEIRKEMMPSDIDDRSVEVILKISDHLLNLDEYYAKLSDVKPSKNVFHECKLPISERLVKLKKYIRIRKPEKTKTRLAWADQELIEYQSSLLANSHINDAVKYEECINETKKVISDIQIEEVRRITKDSVKNRSDLKSMISKIVGIENIEKYTVLCIKELRSINSLKKSISTFSFTARLREKQIGQEVLNRVFL